MEILQRAINACLEAHGEYSKKQEYSVRKWDNQTPYGIHPLWCAMALLQESNLPGLVNREKCALALLFHDVRENTTMKLPEWLPQDTIELVELMTFTSEPGSTEIEMREIWNRPVIVRLLKLYDKVSNLLDGSWMSDEKWNDQYVPYVLQLVDDVEKNYGQLNIVRMARAIAVPRKSFQGKRKEVKMKEQTKIDELALMVLEAKAVEIRDISLKVTNEEVEKLPRENQPFLYASGNWGPGYVTIKNLVGRKEIIRLLTRQLAQKIAEKVPQLNFVAGNVTGGVIPGWLLSEYLESPLGRTVPFVYIRDMRKKGGQKELITGIANNPEISQSDNALVVEELVNFAQTTCNGAKALREAGYQAGHAATILFYNNPEAIKALEEAKIEMIYLFTLPQLLEIAERNHTHPQKVIDGYREFLKDPLGWQAERGLKPVERGGTK